MKILNFFILLIFLISPILSITPNELEEITFDGQYFSHFYTENEPKYFKIIIQTEEIKDYLKIEVINIVEKESPNLIMAFSNNDEECLDREQLSQGINNIQMWLTKSQVENKNNYLNIACSSSSCSYELRITANDTIEMDYNSQFNLYVTENNKNVEIEFSLLSDSSSESDFLTIWAIGNKNVKADLITDVEYKKYTNNNIFKISKNSINKTVYLLKITGEEGDVINIGSSTIFTNDYDDLIINQPEIKGYLNKEFSNQDCYQFTKDNAYTSSSTFYLSGIIHTKIAEIYYKNENGEEISDSISIIKNGSFIHSLTPDDNLNNFCIRFPTKETENYDINEIFYSLQLTDPSQSENKINLYSPQIYGEQYPRLLEEGEIYSYIGVSPKDGVNQISIDMISQFGFPDMYYELCTNYPLCNKYEDETNPRSINGHSTHKIKYEKKSPMDPNQYVLKVKCVKSENVGGPCRFKTLFNSDLDSINLKEDEPFSQYIIKNEKDLYKIDYSGEKKIQKIYVDLIVFTGDVIFNTEDSKLQVKKIYNSNKIFYSITINHALEDKEINFSVSASRNSYYSIEFMFVRENDDSWLTNIIEPGISYLVTIDPEAEDSTGVKKPYKIAKFSNLRMIDENPFLVQFYSLNCKLNVTAKRIDDEGKYSYENIESFDQYYQDIVIKNKINEYEYVLYITETDLSKYNNKLCMVYASSLELNYNEELDERQILISDNEPRQMTFKRNYKEIEYLYPHSNSTNDIIVKFNLLDLATYTVTISFAHQKNSEYIQTGNDLIYLSHNEWKNICKENEICPIIIKIVLTSTFEEREPKLLISVKGVQENTPSYLTKNQAKLDFLLGNNWQYYYTDLGVGEDGDVIVSYRRGSGRLFGKIVPKDATEPEEGANWREMYKFPTTVEESLEFYGYIKKILIKKNETEICKNGCYLLLSLKTSIISQDDFNHDFREHPFSIIIHTRTSEDIKDIPIINMPLSEYIIGNLYTHEDGRINEYYSTIFTHNSHKISFDFQSKVVNFYINVGNNIKPTINEYDFKYESNGEDTLFEITKDDFLNKCKERGIVIPHENSLLGLSLIIGLWTNKTDSLYTTVYSMKIHLPFSDLLDIYEVKSDQKTLCKTQKINNNEYRCLFMIFYLGIDQVNHLLLYPKIQDHSSYDMFAKFIMQERYENFDFSYLKAQIPDYEATFSTRKTGLGYLYVEHGVQDDNFLYVSVITKTETTVELLSSLYSYDLQLSPNPSSPQLFAVNNEHFLFEFTTYEDLIITIQSISGKGTIYWESDKNVQYTIQGKDDLIYLTNSLIDKSDDSKVFSNLYIGNNNGLNKKSPGFAFYIDYILRPPNTNLDEIQIGRSTQIAYRNTDLPIYIYSQLKDLDKDTNIFVNLYELVGESISQFTTSIPFEISATIIDESNLNDLKLNIEKIDKLNFDFKGTYDPMIKTGYVLLTKDDLKKQIKIEEGPRLIFKLSKNQNFPNMKNFTRINLEAAIYQENSEIPIVSNIYHFGKLSLNSDKNSYKLKTDKTSKYMRIHYSPNSNHIKFAISKTQGSTNNDTFNEYKIEFIDGKYIITFNSNPDKNDFIYLTIFHNDTERASSDKITNYAFKYMNSDNVDNFILYKLLENEGFQLDVKENEKTFDYTFTISTLSSYSNLDITYFIKFVSKEEWIEDEADNSIAIRESKSFIQELNNLEIEDNRFVKKYENIEEIDYRYVHVIALVKDGLNVEYVGYKSIYVKDSIVWKIILIVVAAVIVGIIIFFLIRYYIRKRRNLDKKVEKISGPMVSRVSEA